MGKKKGGVAMKNISILVVDDDPATIRSAWNALNREGYSVEGVLSGEEAMHRIERNNYTLAFIDLAMPGMDTVALIRWIRQFRPAVSIVVLADYKMQETIKEAHKLGIISILRKPFTPAILREVTKRTIELIQMNTPENKLGEEFSPVMFAELDKVIHQYREKPNSMIVVLLRAQDIFGYLPLVVQEHIAQGLNIYPSEIRSIVSFYSCFRTKPGGDHPRCYISGSGRAWIGVPWKTGKRVANAVNEFIKWRQLGNVKG